MEKKEKRRSKKRRKEAAGTLHSTMNPRKAKGRRKTRNPPRRQRLIRHPRNRRHRAAHRSMATEIHIDDKWGRSRKCRTNEEATEIRNLN